MTPQLLFINGSRHGTKGQSQFFIEHLKKQEAGAWSFEQLTLSEEKNKKNWEQKISKAQAFVFLTGTYWDSWGSPLQYFLEETTDWETSALWLGKPAAVLISMHSVGGKSVLSRLQGVLNTLGLSLPPLTGFAYSLAGHLAQQSDNLHLPDLWSMDDLKIVMHNLKIATNFFHDNNAKFKAWPVDKENFEAPWL
jgi:multimeric flavodoxin WrbA